MVCHLSHNIQISAAPQYLQRILQYSGGLLLFGLLNCMHTSIGGDPGILKMWQYRRCGYHIAANRRSFAVTLNRRRC